MKDHVAEGYVQIDELDWKPFPEDSEFYMTFLGPLQFINPDGSPLAIVSWEQVQGAWEA